MAELTEDVTVVLNYYNKSAKLLNSQMMALKNQTIKAKCIWGCFLGCKDDTLLDAFLKWKDEFTNIYHITSDYNFKYIGRYQLALTAPTEYGIVLDDDRIPCPDFIKKTVEILKSQECIVGQYGWILDETNMDINGLFVFPGWYHRNKKMMDYVYSKYDFFSDNKKANIDASFNICDNLLNNFVPDKESDLIKVDYLCGGLSFRKSTLYKLFTETIHTVDTGEDIIFCLRANNLNIPVYYHDPERSELLETRDEKITSTSSLSIYLKRTELIPKMKNITNQ